MRGNRLADTLTELEHRQDPTLTPSQSAEARLHRSFGRYAELLKRGRPMAARLALEDYRAAEEELRRSRRRLLEETARATAALFGRKGGRDV